MLRNEALISAIIAIGLTFSACATVPVPIAESGRVVYTAPIGPTPSGAPMPAESTTAPPRSDAGNAVRVVAGLACTGGVAFLGVLLVNPGAFGAVPQCW